MKKILSLLLLLATISIALPSCSNDDEPDMGIKQNIIGTWEGTEVNVKGEWIDITKYPYTKLAFSATFLKNGTYYGEGALGTGSGTYLVKGNTVETYVAGQLYFKYVVKSMTPTTAELTIIEGSSTLDVRVRKKI